jgi:hypothetical protein
MLKKENMPPFATITYCTMYNVGKGEKGTPFRVRALGLGAKTTE